MNNEILAFVTRYVEQNGRGCPKGALIHVGGFKAKDIAAMVDAGALEAGRGNEGGLFPMGQKPTPKTDGGDSLKSRAFEYLRGLAIRGDVVAGDLVKEYDEMNASRRKA
jgi:hypothetical protein